MSSDAPPAFRLVGLRKTFGHHVAVERAELTVRQGSFFGLVGPNGAGKTTMLSMSVGLLRPDEGRAEVFGIDVWQAPERAKQLMGVLPDGLALPEHLTGRELLTYIGRLRGLDDSTAQDRMNGLLTALELDGDAEATLIIDYSTGMRKKIGLATALLGRPRLLVLDEPFEAVDPVSVVMLKRILNRFVASGGSVLLSSHVMATVEQLCDTVAVMAGGEIIADGPLDQIRNNRSLEEAFISLVGTTRENDGEALSWLSP
ncbi:ABC transporter ATP-binding protein [Streptomyces sp. NPDC008343]|uniref:ABC transporter ATP-binding protein n=1 Tax=Streptomyces sp. NPDC008343 TaxID=3364828 RepID=UPI0036ED25C3